MKRLALAAAVMLIAACGAREEVPAIDSAAAAPTMEPAPVVDSVAMDTMNHDTAADTTQQ